MTSFQVAVQQLRDDSTRFDQAAETTGSVGQVVASAPAGIVAEWGWWEDAAEPIRECMTRVKMQTDSGSRELNITAETLMQVMRVYIQQELDNTHAATQIY